MRRANVIVYLPLIMVVGCVAPHSLVGIKKQDRSYSQCMVGQVRAVPPEFRAKRWDCADVSNPAVCGNSTIRAESDQLSDLEKAAHDGSPKDRSKDSKPAEPRTCRRCRQSPCTCNSSVDNNDGSAKLFLLAISSPFTVPAWALGDDYDHYTSIPDYPYANGGSGSLIINTESTTTKKGYWSGNAQLAAVPGFDNLDRVSGRLRLDSDLRFGIDTESNYWFGKRSTGGTDHLWTGDANIVFRFAESEHVQFYAGVGVNWLADQTRPEAGFNFSYGVDWFPVRPWTVSSVIDCGTLGHGSLLHNRSTVGVMIGHAELFAGYDYFQLDSFKSQGPVAGIGWRF